MPKSRHDELHRDIIEEVSVILYLREIGAYRHVIFHEKPQAFCAKHMNQHARELGVSSYRDKKLLARAVQRLSEEASFKTHWRKGVWNFWITHEFFDEPAYGMITRGKKRPPRPDEMASRVVESWTGGSLADVVFAHRIGAPLARAISTTWIDTKNSSPTEGDVALHLALPIIDGIEIKDLLLLREDDKPFFEKFRHALRKAIEEQIRLKDSAPPQVVAQAVIRENIQPALDEIEARLRIDKSKLSKKLGASWSVGTVLTSAGLIGSLPLLVGSGAVALGASLLHIYKYFDDYGDNVQSEDMYFLWKAKKVASSGHSVSIANVCR